MNARTLSVSIAFVLALVACGGGGSDSAQTPDSQTTDGASDVPSNGDALGDTPVDAPPLDPADWLDKPLRDQVAVLETGQLSSAGLVQGYLDRMDARDKGASGIHAIIVLDPDAVAHAAALDAARGKGAKLQGAVILVKDNVDTKGMATTAGSLAMANNVPTADAHVVARLHDEQALMFGKTNLSEWANFRSYNSSSGWSSLGGQTNNGANPAYNPCGSSSGSAAAVKAGLASAALGTETSGSITCPASINGVVGFKPTVGLVSRAGVIPISSSQDTVGPITRTVGDAARVLSVLAGADSADPATASIPAGFSFDFETPLTTATLSGKRLGVLSFGASTAVNTLFADAKTRLQGAGAVLVDVKLGASTGSADYTVEIYEFKVGIDAYLAAHPIPGQATSLADLIAYDSANASTVMPFFGQEIFNDAEATTGLTSPTYLTAKKSAVDGMRTNIDGVLTTNGLDALIAPTTPPAWKTNHATGDPSLGGFASGPAAAAGYPHLTVPMGDVGGLPVGLSFFASAWDDAKVLALGYAFEQLK